MNIVVFGMGYVGLSLAVMFAEKHSVKAVDVVAEKVEMVNNKISPIDDVDITSFLKEKKLDLTASLNWKDSIQDAELVIVATPTNYDEITGFFDTSLVEQVIHNVRSVNPEVDIVIKSTIPVGFVSEMNSQGYDGIYFMPEFLREGKALHDCLYPSRIIVGNKGEKGRQLAALFKDSCYVEDVSVILTNPMEAEAIKLFSNTYLALRVAYFNELDTYACMHGLNVKEIIQGVGTDPRIGMHYCNPSFGYGGYCLPKDTKQLLANYQNIPEELIRAVVKSNETRKKFIIGLLKENAEKTIGVYRLTMKAGSDNFRSAAIIDIIEELKKSDVNIVIYEPRLNQNSYMGCEVCSNFMLFIQKCDLIVANRYSEELEPFKNKVFTRDVFGNG